MCCAKRCSATGAECAGSFGSVGGGKEIGRARIGSVGEQGYRSGSCVGRACERSCTSASRHVPGRMGCDMGGGVWPPWDLCASWSLERCAGHSGAGEPQGNALEDRELCDRWGERARRPREDVLTEGAPAQAFGGSGAEREVVRRVLRFKRVAHRRCCAGAHSCTGGFRPSAQSTLRNATARCMLVTWRGSNVACPRPCGTDWRSASRRCAGHRRQRRAAPEQGVARFKFSPAVFEITTETAATAFTVEPDMLRAVRWKAEIDAWLRQWAHR